MNDGCHIKSLIKGERYASFLSVGLTLKVDVQLLHGGYYCINLTTQMTSLIFMCAQCSI